ncbi:hypothetical protein DV453_001326 [Geotrichum candidum]|nr:hypothetical protein DV453_001326 [Geotrichum candidum]
MNFNQAPAFFQQQQQQQQQQQKSGNAGFRNVEGWASDFSNLHISQQQPHGQVVNGGGWHEQFLQQQNAAPGLAPATSMASYSQVSMYNTSSMQQPMQLQQQQQQQTVLSKQQEDKLFEDAFSNIEKEFQQPVAEVVQIADPIVEEQQVQSQEPEKVDENVELSRIANHIVNNIDPSNEKLKSSNFMMLMQQLSQQQVRLDGDKFVDNNGVDIRDMPASAATINEKPAAESSIPAARVLNSETSINESFGKPPHEQDTTMSSLPDPLEFLEAQARDSGETNPEKIYSPLEFAKLLAPQGVPHPSSWEEKYHDYF